MARHEPQVNFRIPQELKDKLEQSAKDSGRSITKELVMRLEQSYGQNLEPTLTETETIARMANEMTDLATENREMRRLYIESLHKNFDNIPLGLKSTYGKLLNRLLEDLTDEERQELDNINPQTKTAQ